MIFYKRSTSNFIKKTKVIVTLSQFAKQAIIKNYNTDADKIEVVYSGINEIFDRINIEERETTKEKYADGNEYFIYTGEIGPDKNLVNLLRAFSAFKKRQKSGMQLIIAGNYGKKYEEFLDQLRLFKFREEVKVLEKLTPEKSAKITASAYAMVYPSLFENFATQALQAMKSDVPVITSPNTAIHEICEDAALYANPENFKEIALQMISVFQNENLRSKLIEKGRVQAKKYNWNMTANLFWKAIEKTMSH